MNKNRKIALFDLDDTLADYSGQLEKDLRMISSDNKSQYVHFEKEKNPKWIENRKKLITSQQNWWYNLPKNKLGFDVLKMCQKLGFEIMILTKGPLSKENAWQEKVKWAKKYLGDNVNITITTDKSLMYGTVLVDDFPGYVIPWLEHRPRGIVIMPQKPHNENTKYKRVYQYDGTKENSQFIFEKLKEAFER